MSHSFNHMLVKAYASQPVDDLLAASPSALKGVSEADAQALKQAFGITSIRDLADNKFFQRAQSIRAMLEIPRYDPGPPPEWDDFFAGAPLPYYEQHPSGRFRQQFGPVYYRGRLDGSARVLILGQDPATNELIAHRVFVGRSGQRIQGLLNRLGITRSYIMLNTFLFSVYDQFDAELEQISVEDTIITYRHAFLDRLIEENQIEAIFTMGKGAHHGAGLWPGKGDIPVYEFTHPAALNYAALFSNWNAGIDVMKDVVRPDEDGTPTYAHYGSRWEEGDLPAIPRFDLPFGIPDWHGTSSRATRDGDHRIIWKAPQS